MPSLADPLHVREVPHVRAALIALALFVSACPDVSAPAIGAVCVKRGEKCKTESGPLGVCDTIACPANESGPCFRCMPQH